MNEQPGARASTDGGAPDVQPSECEDIDLSSDEKNCGRCGRSCEGTSCTAGRCGVRTLHESANLVSLGAGDKSWVYVRKWDDTAGAGEILRVEKSSGGVATPIYGSFAGWKLYGSGLSVVGDDVFFTATDESGLQRVFEQPSEATSKPIAVAPTECASTAGAPACHGLQTDGEAFVWRQQEKLFACKLPCTTPAAHSDGALIGAGLGGTHVFFGTSAAGVSRCERDGCTDVASFSSAPPATTQPEHFVVRGTNVYWVDNQIGDDKARVLTCSVTGCTGAPKVLVKGEFQIGDLAVGDAGLVFTYGGRESGEPDGVVKLCRDIRDGCGVGSEILADKLAHPTKVALDGKLVYFLTTGTTDPTKVGGVHRVAW